MSRELRGRLDDRISVWHVHIDTTQQTETSVLAFGKRGGQSVVLKVIKSPGDEWQSGDVLSAFDGRGVIRVLEHVPGAMLLERASPGTSLVSLTANGADDPATEAIASVIAKMSPRQPMTAVPTVVEWGRAFEHYQASGQTQIPTLLVNDARRMFSDLCVSQSRPRLLHGDLHHYNVLFDDDRGWLAIDAKGVFGEPEYEIGAVLRNPYELPELFTDPIMIARRVDRFARDLGLNADRILAWAFAQSVLSMIWGWEDGSVIDNTHPQIALAQAIRPMLKLH